MNRIVQRICLVAALLLAGACSRTDIFGDLAPPAEPGAVQISVDPPQTTVQLTRAQPFTATPTPAMAGASFTWSVDPAEGGGSIDESGFYTAPAALPEGATSNFRVTIRASFKDRPEIFGDAIVTLAPLQ